MDFETIILKKEDGVATLIFNRPERLNAINMISMSDIRAGLNDVAGDETLRVLVLTGAGRAFCAGGDFKRQKEDEPLSPAGLADKTKSQEFKPTDVAQAVRSYTKNINLVLQNLDIPTIAMVNGVATGQGFSMALACDIRIGSENARFGVAWTKRALVPAFGDTWLLPRIVGLGAACDLIFTGRTIDAEEAFRIGILNRLVKAEELEKETYAYARQLAKGPTVAIRLSKLNLYNGLQMDFESALESLASAQAQLFFTEDLQESTRAFQEKREPVFKGK